MTSDTLLPKGRKVEQVLEGAREVFMADGFEGASVDTIARKAGVSKATLYSYFPDKRLLFMAVASGVCSRQATETCDEVCMDSPASVVLGKIGRDLLQYMLSPLGQRVFRICVAESDRFPDLGQRFWESGPALIERMLVQFFERAEERGELQIDDRSLAAHQFAELCKARIFPRLVFNMQTEFSGGEIDEVVDSAVEMFLARHGASDGSHSAVLAAAE